MNEKLFEELLSSVRWMNDHRRGKRTKVGRVTLVPDVDVKRIRAATKLSQAKFAQLLSIEVATLRNWEQGRREPTGPAKVLLRALNNDPMSVLKALRVG